MGGRIVPYNFATKIHEKFLIFTPQKIREKLAHHLSFKAKNDGLESKSKSV